MCFFAGRSTPCSRLKLNSEYGFRRRESLARIGLRHVSTLERGASWRRTAGCHEGHASAGDPFVLRHCKHTHSVASVSVVKRYLAQLAGDQAAADREALRWFFRESRRCTAIVNLTRGGTPKETGQTTKGRLDEHSSEPRRDTGWRHRARIDRRCCPTSAHDAAAGCARSRQRRLGARLDHRDSPEGFSLADRADVSRVGEALRRFPGAAFTLRRGGSGRRRVPQRARGAAAGRSVRAKTGVKRVVFFLMEEALRRSLGEIEFQRAYPRKNFQRCRRLSSGTRRTENRRRTTEGGRPECLFLKRGARGEIEDTRPVDMVDQGPQSVAWTFSCSALFAISV